MPVMIPLEQEYAFVLSCLQSSLDNDGKIDFNAVAKQHKTTVSGAQQRIRRCLRSSISVAKDGPSGSGSESNVADVAESSKSHAEPERPTGGKKSKVGSKKRKVGEVIKHEEDDAIGEGGVASSGYA